MKPTLSDLVVYIENENKIQIVTTHYFGVFDHCESGYFSSLWSNRLFFGRLVFGRMGFFWSIGLGSNGLRSIGQSPLWLPQYSESCKMCRFRNQIYDRNFSKIKQAVICDNYFEALITSITNQYFHHFCLKNSYNKEQHHCCLFLSKIVDNMLVN